MTAAELVAANYGLLLHYARRLAPWAAEDIAQDAAELALRWDNYKPGKPVRNWLYWCVMSARAKHEYASRRAGRSKEAAKQGDRHTEPNQEHAAELALVRDRVDALPFHQRRAMNGVMAGLDSGDMSRALGCSREAIRKQVHKARAALAA